MIDSLCYWNILLDQSGLTKWKEYKFKLLKKDGQRRYNKLSFVIIEYFQSSLVKYFKGLILDWILLNIYLGYA